MTTDKIYPKLFSDPSVDAIYCSPGWREILFALCHTLQAHPDRHPEAPQVVVAQVKSKFGERHFFMTVVTLTAGTFWPSRKSFRWLVEGARCSVSHVAHLKLIPRLSQF